FGAADALLAPLPPRAQPLDARLGRIEPEVADAARLDERLQHVVVRPFAAADVEHVAVERGQDLAHARVVAREQIFEHRLPQTGAALALGTGRALGGALELAEVARKIVDRILLRTVEVDLAELVLEAHDLGVREVARGGAKAGD